MARSAGRYGGARRARGASAPPSILKAGRLGHLWQTWRQSIYVDILLASTSTFIKSVKSPRLSHQL